MQSCTYYAHYMHISWHLSIHNSKWEKTLEVIVHLRTTFFLLILSFQVCKSVYMEHNEVKM